MTDYEPEGVDGATIDQQAAARRMPNGSTVSRALRRDAAIITTPRGRAGYHVSNGTQWSAPSISVDVSDLESVNVRRAAELHDHLTACGWELGRSVDATILYATRVPSNREAANRAANAEADQ